VLSSHVNWAGLAPPGLKSGTQQLHADLPSEAGFAIVLRIVVQDVENEPPAPTPL